MRILVDADACPTAIKKVLIKAAVKRDIETVFYANHTLNLPPYKQIRFKQVGMGFDVADQAIVEDVTAKDVVISADIPLADDVIKKGALVITPSGMELNKQNIGEALSIRNFYTEARESGFGSNRQSGMDSKKIQAFAGALDRCLARR